MRKLNYQETLEILEKFNIDTGLRDFCSACGRCCQGCYESKNACYRNEGRRLPCSVFFCYSIRSRIFTFQQHELYYRLGEYICRKVSQYGIKKWFHRRDHIYYNKVYHYNKMVKEFTIPTSLIAWLQGESLKNTIRKKVMKYRKDIIKEVKTNYGEGALLGDNIL